MYPLPGPGQLEEKLRTKRYAAFIVEGLQSEAGLRLLPKEQFLEVQRLCRQYGTLLVLDEVQTGLGRTGTMWYFQQEGLEPDIVVTGKGLSGGVYPITATLMTAELHAFFADHPFVHISTFGGAELGCVAALAVLDVVEAPGFLERVGELGERFERGLTGVDGELRRRGLFMGLKLQNEGDAMLAARAVIEAGVFAVFANNDTSVLQLLPPLTISDDEADDIIGIVRSALR